MRASLTVAFIGAGLLASPATGIGPSADRSPSTMVREQGTVELAQGRQCQQRAGPLTQETAWARWRQARAQGYAVSNGVVPCWDNWTRGYCFFVFYPC
jgi:hypothetical protein